MADKSIMSYETVALDDEKSALVILDQTKLPYEVEILSLTDQKDIWNAIYLLQVRGRARHRRGGGLWRVSGRQADPGRQLGGFLHSVQGRQGLPQLLPSYRRQSILGAQPHGAGGAGQQGQERS